MTHTSLGSPLSNSSESELPYLKRSAWIRVAVALIWVGAHLRRRAADCPVLAVGHENQERLLRRPPNQLVQEQLFTGTGRACGREKGWAWGVGRGALSPCLRLHWPPAAGHSAEPVGHCDLGFLVVFPLELWLCFLPSAPAVSDLQSCDSRTCFDSKLALLAWFNSRLHLGVAGVDARGRRP